MPRFTAGLCSRLATWFAIRLNIHWASAVNAGKRNIYAYIGRLWIFGLRHGTIKSINIVKQRPDENMAKPGRDQTG